LAKELEYLGPVKNASLLQGREVKFIGVVVGHEDGLDSYTNLIITLKDGKLSHIEVGDVAFGQGDAINDAVAWLDAHYWEAK